MQYKISFKIFIAILAVLCVPQSTSAQSRCVNPNQRRGFCTSIYGCKPLLLVAGRKPLQELDRKFVLDSQCLGGVGKPPHVCCTEDTGFLRNQPSEGRSTVSFPISQNNPFGQQPRRRISSSSARGKIPGPPACGGVTLQNKIYGGDDTDLFEFPWLAMLEYRKTPCSNPNQRSGVCTSIYDCQPLLSTACRKPLQDLDRKFLLDSRCLGGLGKAPHVCCTPDTGYLRIHFNPSPPRGQVPGPPACGGITVRNKIYNGEDTDIFEFPWLALLEYGKRNGARSTNCGGSLINQRYIVTAAHCVTGAIEREVGPLTGIILGEYDTTRSIDCVDGACANSAIRVGVEEIRPHEGYSDTQVHRHNDIALVRMDRNIIYSDSIRPICLPLSVPNEQLRSGTQLTVAGWGRTLRSQKSPVKQKVQVPLTDQGECRQKFFTRKIEIIDSQVCAGGVYAEDSCDGDSGGPLMSVRGGVWVLEGVVSFGVRCGFEGWPAVHTRVASYDNWLRERIRA